MHLYATKNRLVIIVNCDIKDGTKAKVWNTKHRMNIKDEAEKGLL